MNSRPPTSPIRLALVLAFTITCGGAALGAFVDHTNKAGRSNPLGEPSSAVLAGLGLAVLAGFRFANPAVHRPRSPRPAAARSRARLRLVAGTGGVHRLQR